jgi:hypothetical protein
MPAAASANYQGASLIYRSCAGAKQQNCTLVGRDELYYRAWVKLAPDHQYVHHFMSLGGTRPDDYWGSDGGAGCRPNGQDAAGTTLDFNQSHELFFYTYSPDMTCDSPDAGGGYCRNMQPTLCDDCAARGTPCASSWENGWECCWGNLFPTSRPWPVLPRSQWVCLELRMKLNSATPAVLADGEMTYWVDGVQGHHQTGMHWRDNATLQLNKLSVQHYIEDGDATQSNRIWWDNIIASTARIGCGTPPPNDGGPPPDGLPPADGPASGDPRRPADAAPPSDSPAGGPAATHGPAAMVAGCEACASASPDLAWLLALLLLFRRTRAHGGGRSRSFC